MMRKFLLPLVFLPFVSCKKGEVIQKPLIVSQTLNLKAEYSKPVSIDINNDQVVDYIFSTVLMQNNGLDYTYYSVRTASGQQRNRVLIAPTDDIPGEGWVVAHENGIEISSTLPSAQTSWNNVTSFLMGFTETGGGVATFEGDFANKGEKYIGIMFTLDQKNYFGWIKINHLNNNRYIEIKECAYNAIPEHSIKTGQTK